MAKNGKFNKSPVLGLKSGFTDSILDIKSWRLTEYLLGRGLNFPFSIFLPKSNMLFPTNGLVKADNSYIMQPSDQMSDF